jgi:hypothetical protein
MRGCYLFALALLFAAAPAFAQDTTWTPLFDGGELVAWKHVGDGRFVVEDSLLKTEGGMGLLWFTGRKVGGEVIRVVYKNPGPTNAGVFIRIPERPTEPWMPVNRGYEVQIDPREDEWHSTGVLYSLTQAKAKPDRPGDAWNTMEITLDGDRTLVTVNGVVVTDYREGDPVPRKKIWYEPDRGRRPTLGYIGLQNHGEGDTVYFKEISVRPLPK